MHETGVTCVGCHCTQAAEGDAKRPLEGGVDAPAAKKPETESAQAGKAADQAAETESEESGSDEESESEDDSDEDSDEVQEVHCIIGRCTSML